MSTRRPYPRTINGAFDSLMVDGRKLSTLDAEQHFKRIKAKRGGEWAKELHALVFDLTYGHRKSLGVWTSGTTGTPKGVTISQRDLVNSARLTYDTFDLQEGDRVLLCLPCAYIAGKMMVVRAFALGLDLHVISPHGPVLKNLKVADRFRFTPMVPLQLHRAIQDDRKRVERQFQTILLGGGPVSDALEEDVQDLRTEVFQGYASTETVTHVALRRINGARRSEAYHAIGRVTFGTDERGCLIVHTPHLTRKQHVTNDLVELVDSTHFRWMGRIDNVILSGGKKIYPEQLEAKSAGVIPFPHYFTATPNDQLGQAVALVLETGEGPQVIDSVIQTLSTVLTLHEMPRRIVAMRAFHRTASGKVIRYKV